MGSDDIDSKLAHSAFLWHLWLAYEQLSWGKTTKKMAVTIANKTILTKRTPQPSHHYYLVLFL